MTSLKNMCEKYFGTDDIYEVLGVNRNATEKEIKKAYHKLSLCVHPDRVDDHLKDIATEKFKVLGKIHSILQDSDKRKYYDDCGEIDEENDSGFNWMEYWRAIFKKIELKDIAKYEKEYIGSETELRDVKRAYTGTHGNMDLMLEMIPFSNCESEPRIIEIVKKMIDEGEVEEYPGFFNEPKRKKNMRRKKWEKEKQEASMVNLDELEKEIAVNHEKRLKNFHDLVSDIEARYSGGTKRKAISAGKKGPPSKVSRKATKSKK